MKLLLVVSLSANLAVTGLLLGRAVHHWRDGAVDREHKAEPGLDRWQSRILSLVPAGRRDAARALLLSRQDEYGTARATMIDAQQALIAALKMDPFNAEVLGAALTERQKARRLLGEIGSSQLAEIAMFLTKTERTEMADRLEEQSRRWTERQRE